MFWDRRKKYDFYLCGPMRSYPDLNRPLFIKVANLLRKAEYTVWNPAENDSYLQSSFAQCMTKDLDAIINQCDNIALLPGWRDSLGGNGEVFCAYLCGKAAVEVVILFADDKDLDIDLVPVDLSGYHLPYGNGKYYNFDPHKCSAETPLPESSVIPEDKEDACDH